MQAKKGTLSYEDYVDGIQNLEPEDQLRIVEIISANLKRSLRKKKQEHSLMELEGLGAEIWKDVDAREYVNKERESWD